VAWQPPTTQGGFGLWLTLLFSFDDISCHDNVSRTDVAVGNLLLTDLFAFAITLAIATNRWRETPFSMLYSIVSVGVFN
jgi:hypothetical protein